MCFAVLAAHSEASAAECSTPTPECHLSNGTKLIKSDPKRAAAELLASFRLDERTDTLTLYATALTADRQYARALDTWQRIIVFRESEIEAAKEAMAKGSKKARDAARAKQARAQELSEEAAAEIIKLWSNVARVTITLSPGEQFVVTDEGLELDVSKEFLVNAGRDELTFRFKDGRVETLVVEIQAGQAKTIEAPKPRAIAPVVKEPVVEEPIAAPPAVIEDRPASVVETPMADMSTRRYVEGPRSVTMSRVGLGFVAGGVVGLGISGTLGYLASRDFDRAQDLGCNSDGQCPLGSAANLGEQSNDRARLAQITGITGGALLVTGVTMWVIGRGTTRRAVNDVTVSVGPSSVSLGWSLK